MDAGLKSSQFIMNMITINGKEAPQLTWSALTHSQHLKSVFVRVTYLTALYIKYIVSCTPVSLENVDILTLHNGMLSWMQEHDENTITEFFKRLKMVKTVKISNYLYPNYLEGIIRKAVRVVIDSGQMAQLYMLLNAFKADQNSLTCKTEYFFHSNDEMVVDDIEQLRVEIHKGKYISVKYNLYAFKPLPPSGTKITTAASEVIDSLSLSTDHISVTSFKKLFIYAFENYSHLKELKVECYNDITDTETRISLFTSRDNYSNHQRGLLHTEDDDSIESNQNFNNFTNIKLERIIIAADLPQLLSSALPNISSIQYTSCAISQSYSQYYCPMQEKEDIDFTNFTSDLTQFKNLSDLCIRDLDTQNVDYIFVQFKFTDAEEDTEYYEIRKSDDATKKKYNFNSTTMDFINKCKVDSCVSPRLKTFSLMAFRYNRTNEITFYGDNDPIASLHLGVLQQWLLHPLILHDGWLLKYSLVLFVLLTFM